VIELFLCEVKKIIIALSGAIHFFWGNMKISRPKWKQQNQIKRGTSASLSMLLQLQANLSDGLLLSDDHSWIFFLLFLLCLPLPL